jgi:hypothetical protein
MHCKFAKDPVPQLSSSRFSMTLYGKCLQSRCLHGTMHTSAGSFCILFRPGFAVVSG